MRNKLLRFLPVAVCAVTLAFTAESAFSQSGGDAKSANPAANDPGKVKNDEIAEARRLIPGQAGEPECVWLGRRAVLAMFNDDTDASLRLMDLYDRFRCPGTHIQEAFRCMVKMSAPEEPAIKDPNKRAHACWLNPATSVQPATATTASSPAAATTRQK